MTKVLVVGGAGHVGLPFSIHMANRGVDVTVFDHNSKLIKKIRAGKYPYSEPEGETFLEQALDQKFKLIDKLDKVKRDYDFVHVMMGTPVDKDGVGQLVGLLDMAYVLRNHFGDNKPVMILRSTVSIGTTKLVEREYGGPVFFCPERVAEGASFTEIRSLPQFIGKPTDPSWMDEWLPAEIASLITKVEEHFLEDVGVPASFIVTQEEAELAKLITNMYRYVNFAFSNEIAMLMADKNIDVNRIIKLANYDYPRMNMALPGPAQGPCLFKDNFLLLDGNLTDGVIAASHNINTHMPEFYVQQFEKQVESEDRCNILVMGTAFKANTNDTRDALSAKLVAILENKGHIVTTWDPEVSEYDANWTPEFQSYDAIFVMVNHHMFKDYWYSIEEAAISGTIVIDPWDMY